VRILLPSPPPSPHLRSAFSTPHPDDTLSLRRSHSSILEPNNPHSDPFFGIRGPTNNRVHQEAGNSVRLANGEEEENDNADQ